MMANQILVVTHNGKMPNEGGLRIGYLVGNVFVAIGGKTTVLAVPKKEKPKAAEEKTIEAPIKYYLLPRSLGHDGECRYCGHFPNSPRLIMTDEGLKKVIICSSCGKQMRPSDFLW